jgi:hypothetical protein
LFQTKRDKHSCLFEEIRDVFLIFTVLPDANLDVVRDQVVEAMRRRRHVLHNQDNDFDVADLDPIVCLRYE